MYKQPSSKTIPPGLTTNLSRLQLIYNIYDNNVACIGTLDDEQNMCCTNLNSKKKAKQKWIFRYWNCLQKQQQINEWQVKIEKGYEIGEVIAVQKRTYALWILPKNTRKLNKQQEKKEQLKLQQHIIIMQAPAGHKMEVPTYHKMPIKSIKSNGIIIKEQNFFQVKRQFSYQHKLNALVCVWQLRNKQAEVVQFNNLAHANHQPSFIIRLTYISLSHLLSFQGQSTSKVQIGPYLSRQFYIGFRNAAKSYTIVHPSLDLFTTHSSQLIRSMPLLICYEPIPMLPSHMLQAIDRRLSLSIFSMTRDAFSWPNPSVCKVVQVKGYILGIDDTFDQLEVNDQQGQAQIGQIDAEQQEWVDEQENEENQQNEGEQNVNQLVNGLIVDKYSLDTIINLTIHTTHNKKQKLLHVSLNVQKWQGIVKNVSQFPFQNPLDSVLSVGGNVSYIWSWVASFNQNKMIESQTVYLMGLENSTQYKLIQKQILRSSTKHPNMYIDDFNEISMLQTPPVVWSVNQSKEEEEQLQIWKMNSKKVIYMQMLKQIFGKGENQETDVFVDVLAQSTLALL